MKQYRIGDYAKYLGVSPDFLKHYEEQGLITPSRSGSGYRYYSFTTTMRLIECVRLRNYGMTLREIREILTEHTESNEQVERRVAENVRSLEQEVTLDQALIRNYAELTPGASRCSSATGTGMCASAARCSFFRTPTNTTFSTTRASTSCCATG